MGSSDLDGVPACYGDARRLANRSAASQNLANGLQRQHVDGHAHQCQRQDGRAAHGIHIRNGVGSGNAAKVKRIVHDGHEKVCRCNQRLLGIELVNRCIVCRLYTHQQFPRNGEGRSRF